MDLYSHDDYKVLIRNQVKAAGPIRKKMTLRKVAQRVGIQYTYLSRALNHEKAHLSEDHLFSICNILGLYPEEIEYIFLLRSLAVTGDSERRKFLQGKINKLKRAKQINATLQEFDSRRINREMEYLFDPICLITIISLTIKEYLENPLRLCAPLGQSPEKMRQILLRLSDLNFIEMEENGVSVKRVIRSDFHYGTDHPFMRVHQMLLREICGNQLAKASESDKQNFMVTFSADERALKQIKSKFQTFIKEVEGLVSQSLQKNTYQLNFELFKWL